LRKRRRRGEKETSHEKPGRRKGTGRACWFSNRKKPLDGGEEKKISKKENLIEKKLKNGGEAGLRLYSPQGVRGRVKPS